MALLKDSLIAHYKMNDNAATAVVVDETGIHNGEYQINNTPQNTDTGNETGKILGALDFVGGVNGEMVVISDHDDFTPALTPFSICVWVNMHDTSDFIMASKGVYNLNAEWRFFISSSGQFRLLVMDENVSSCHLGRRRIASLLSYQDKWTHLVATYDGGTLSAGIRLYLNSVRVDDGNEENNAGSFATVQAGGHAIWVGRYVGDYANGLIDNMMFFNKELNLNEVRALYNSGRGTEIIPNPGFELSRTGHSFASWQEI